MSWKRASALLLSAAVIAAVASVISVRHPATGAPAVPSTATLRSSAAAPVNELQARQPNTALAIPKVIHLLDHTVGSVKPSAARLVISASLKKKGRPAGGAVYSCAFSSGHLGRCDAAFGLAGGMFLAQLTPQSDGTFKGPIMQGTSKYTGARGTVRVVPTTSGNSKVTISYSTG